MMRALLLALALAFATQASLAQDRACAKADAANAEKAIDRVSNWAQLQKAYKDFHYCDSVAAVADVYSETVVRLIVDWKNVDAFVAEMQSAPFKAFVVEHLKRPIARDDLDSVYSRVKASCPAKHEAFCAELAEIVKAANK
jgi:hypothetical protein